MGNSSSKYLIKTGLLAVALTWLLFTFYQLLPMTCYFRHMKVIFAEIGIEPTKENKKEIDQKIHEYLGVEYKNCSQTWKLIKKHRAENPEHFISELKTVLTQ